jgi:PilZ domain
MRRARRFRVALHIELTDLESETHLEERTTDLSLFGCGVATRNSLAIGAKLRIRIAHKGSHFAALGRVIYVRPYREMGIEFTQIADNDQAILEKWISELRNTRM